MLKIAIDDGHGVGTAGKRTPKFADDSYMEENMFNKEVAENLFQMCEEIGIEAVLVAHEAYDVSLQSRVDRANHADADAYISIHANAYGNDWNNAHGVESWIKEGTGQPTLDLACEIQKGLIKETKRRDRGVKKSDNLYVLNQTKMPAVLVECGFMTNREEAELLRLSEYRMSCAKGIFNGICKHFHIEAVNKEKVEKNPSQTNRFQDIDDLPYGEATVEKLVSKGYLAGSDGGNLDLSKDMLRIFMILDRAGIFDETKDS